MAIIHNTTMHPGKLELLAAWLPAQPWYPHPGRVPVLAKAGGFRLDDPQGEVGIEFMMVTDTAGDQPVTCLVPMTYRAGELAGAGAGLIGTSEHGVLGYRCIYDGAHDPVLAGQLVALIQGDAEPQAQSVSDTPDPTVHGLPVAGGALRVTGSEVVVNGLAGTVIRARTESAGGAESGQLLITVARILQPGDGAAPPGEAGRPCLSATWQLPDGTRIRGTLATARYTPVTGSQP